MKNITAINGPNKDAIDLLIELMEKVEKGEIRDISVAYVTKSGSISGDWSRGGDPFSMYTAISHLGREFYSQLIL